MRPPIRVQQSVSAYPSDGSNEHPGRKPVAGSQFLGGHCRKNVTEADLPTSNINKSGDLIESFLRLTLNSGDKNFFRKIIFGDLHPPVAKRTYPNFTRYKKNFHYQKFSPFINEIFLKF
jgi:hypothetical protein